MDKIIEFVKEWLPKFEKRWDSYRAAGRRRGHCYNLQTFCLRYFPEALAAYSEAVAKAQRELCANKYMGQLHFSDINHKAILSAPSPIAERIKELMEK